MANDPPAPAAAPGDRAAGEWPAPRRRPATYPGAAPSHPYLLVGDRVQPLRVRWEGGQVHVTTAAGTPVDAVLRRLDVAPLAERVPTVAYGANRSPDSLALKFQHHGPDGVPPVVPVLAVRLAGVDAVGAGLSSQGFVYADLVDSPGTRLAALLPLLDHRQLAAVHDSEAVGGAYDCAWLPGVELAGVDGDGVGDRVGDGSARSLGALAYVGRHPVFRDPGADQPLAFAAVPAEGRRFPALHQLDLLARVIAATGVAAPLAPLLGHSAGLGTGAGDDLGQGAGLGTGGDRHDGQGQGVRADALAADLVRLLNGQWWYRHHSGDQAMGAAGAARRLVQEAMARSPWPRAAGSPLTRTLLGRAEAYAPPPDRHLGHQLPLAGPPRPD